MYIIENVDGIEFRNIIITSADGTAAAIRVGAHTDDPSGASAGDMYFNTTDGVLKVYNGSEWSPVGSGSATPELEFQINSDDPVSSAAIIKDFITVDDTSEVLSGKLTDATYETSLDDGDTWTASSSLLISS